MGFVRRVLFGPALRVVADAVKPSGDGLSLASRYVLGLRVSQKHITEILGEDPEAMISALIELVVEYTEETGLDGAKVAEFTRLALVRRGLVPPRLSDVGVA